MVLVTGSFGYIGNALIQKLLADGHSVVGIDSDVKLEWLDEMNSVSALPTLTGVERVRKLRELGPYVHYSMDISKDVGKLRELFQKYQFETVVNLAQMPSAPYSQVDLDHASWTIQNNTIGTLNIVYMIKDYCPDAHLIEIESMGTHNHAINTTIPEGKFQFEFEGRTSEPCIFPKQGGSQYHTTKIFNTYLLDNAYRWWGLKSTSINQGVVHGNWTEEIEQTGIHSHLAFDSTFGTVINRFIVQSLMGIPLTIYGKGDQKRGYIALSDSVQCLTLLINRPSSGFRNINQLSEVFSINQIANKVKGLNEDTQFNYMKSPRVEDTNDFYYNVSTETLKGLGFENKRTIDKELEYVYNTINVDDVKLLEDKYIQ